jgi:hypothetical protein
MLLAEPHTAEPHSHSTTPKWRSATRTLFVGVLLFALTAFQLSCSSASDDAEDAAQAPSSRLQQPAMTNVAPAQLDAMLLSEELIEGFRADMDSLAFAVRNLELPDKRTRRLFRPLDLEINDLAPTADEPDADATLQSLGLRLRNWPIAQSTVATNASLRLWRPLLDEVDHFRWSKFKIKSGHFVEAPAGDLDAPKEFEARVAFVGLARLSSGTLSWVRNAQTLRWRLISGRDPEQNENWRIVAWQVLEANRMDTAALLFEDVIDTAVPDRAQREAARLSIHERYVADRLLAKRAGESFTPPHETFADISNDRHPGLAVVDLDADGFDDLYVVTRWGRNQFLRNRGDGTFEEMAADVGLDVEGFSTSAIFADFDNDGDPDLILGRSFERSAYFENEEGYFIERSSDRVDQALPYFASSISATDYDGDGLLDIYISTYSASIVMLEGYREYLPADDMAELERRWQGHANLLDMIGPPNVLLHNQGGGRFEVVKTPSDLLAFRHTYQATWADFDEDGDPDVYLSNDFAPDTMIRNDGAGQFSEATTELGFSAFGLGMGVSWGDYDRDGRQDVYVTNMYSTAGSRITKQLSYVDQRYREMAQGNFLYRNGADGFSKVSGSGPSDLKVERTGWSWGSQFVDVDNDGFLDLGVLNGFYTAPREVALAGDT